MKKLLMPLVAAILMAVLVGGVNFITDSSMQLSFLPSCEKISTDGSGSFLCNPDNDTDTTYSVFYPYIYLNSTTFGINTTAVQRRVSGTCGVGNSIRVIAEDGSVTCEADSTGSDDQTLVYNTGNDTITIENGNSIDISEVDTDTNANTVCAGTAVYMDGEGNCDTLYTDTTIPDTNETPNVDQINSYRGNLSGTDCAANQKVVGVGSDGIVACDADNDTDTNTNADTICTGTTQYLDGDGNCDTGYLDADGVDADTNTNADTVCAGTTTYLDGEGNCDDISGVYQPLEATLTDIADGTITENLVNTANPWADNEVTDTITASNYLPLAGGTMSGDVNMSSNNVTSVDCIRFASGGSICDT